jgi:hypothetical protein
MPAFLQQPPVLKPMSNNAAMLVDGDHHLKGLYKLEEILLIRLRMSDSRRKALPPPYIPVIKLITWTPPVNVGSLSVKPRRALDDLAVHASQYHNSVHSMGKTTGVLE